MKRHTNIIITAVASLLIVTLAGREFIKNHKKESNDKSSTNVSENTCEDIPDTSIPDTSISDTSVADTNTPEADILDTTYENNKEQFYISEIPDNIFEKCRANPTRQIVHSPEKICDIYMYYTWALTIRCMKVSWL